MTSKKSIKELVKDSSSRNFLPNLQPALSKSTLVKSGAGKTYMNKTNRVGQVGVSPAVRKSSNNYAVAT